MRRLGDLDDPVLTREAAELLGRQLRLLGFNLDFAPVVDVDTNPANPVIGDRSFGADPALVVRHARAFADGLESAGVAACLKHFPGHGDTSLDSHLALPRLVHDRARLERVELLPFRALAPYVACVMTAHVVFDAIDSSRPATLSRQVVTELLRRDVGFRGVVFSDDLEMKAVADGWGVPEAACLAVEAGCDAVLVCKETDLVLAAHAALAERAAREPAFAARLREAAGRSLAARRRFACAPADPAGVADALAALDPAALEARV
jgi:beta-N-acetylhexosaminidase